MPIDVFRCYDSVIQLRCIGTRHDAEPVDYDRYSLLCWKIPVNPGDWRWTPARPSPRLLDQHCSSWFTLPVITLLLLCGDVRRCQAVTVTTLLGCYPITTFPLLPPLPDVAHISLVLMFGDACRHDLLPFNVLLMPRHRGTIAPLALPLLPIAVIVDTALCYCWAQLLR